MEEVVVEKVLAAARQRLHEQLTLDDLAKMACFSKFHFARMFRRVTGASPRRFLYALRLQEAKRLLATTSLSVAEVSNQVGYSSVGTFTSRFAASVGVSPAAYRRLRGDLSGMVRGEAPDPTVPGRIAGRCDGGIGGPMLVGLLRRPLPEGRPVRYDLAGPSGGWSFDHVPAGRWYLVAVGWGPDAELDSQRPPVLIAAKGPVKVGTDRGAVQVTLTMRPLRAVDPPLLFPVSPLPPTRRPSERPVNRRPSERPVTCQVG